MHMFELSKLGLSNDVCSFSVDLANQKLLCPFVFSKSSNPRGEDATSTCKNTYNFWQNNAGEKVQTSLESWNIQNSKNVHCLAVA